MNTFEKVKKLISKGWCKGASARDKCGRPVDPRSDGAVKFCLLGALERVNAPNSAYLKLEAATKARGHCFISRFNDTGTKKKVFELLDELS